MSILAECPNCHAKHAEPIDRRNARPACECGQSFKEPRKRGTLKYWVVFRDDHGKQHKKTVGTSWSDALAADGKAKGKKAEGKILDLVPKKTTFENLTDWYLELPNVKKLRAFDRVEFALKAFNGVFGNKAVNSILPEDLIRYQEQREKDGRSAATIDIELVITKTMVSRAFDNDRADGKALKAFRAVKKKLRAGDNARTRILTIEEYKSLLAAAKEPLRSMVEIGLNTGMRAGEIRCLKWDRVDLETGFIRLRAEDTKEKRPKLIPMNETVRGILAGLLNFDGRDEVFSLTFSAKDVVSQMRSACKGAGVPCGRALADGVTFHDLRRTAKSFMLKAGLAKELRDKLLGHAFEGMDVHYLVVGETALTAAMRQYTKWLAKQLQTGASG